MAEAAEQPRDEAPLEAGAEEAVKIICLGDSAVGKSKYVAPRAPRRRAGPDGAPDGRGVSPQATREVPARRIVFDVQRKVTYKNLNNWYKELREFRPEIPCIVVANKIDADMKVTQKSFNFARKFSLPFYFVSAADGTNVVKLFNDAIKLAVTYKRNSGDFMDEVMQELESFDLEKKSENLSDQEESYPEENPPSS
ncbi:hypothetical protein CIB84_005626 [Bambusicola thoracicus]|uniref:Uncharacterized protein n=1 Tax=Bambusicola thoracicus TaxID=9083 RepID=A0A2P4T2P6_BAMTH|nr:hypothetical protein CIB84_005626 [Bambusicola thoracicus]